MTASAPAVRRNEIIGVLSLAVDFAIGQPVGYGLRSAVASMNAARDLGLDEALAAESYYQGLLQDENMLAALPREQVDGLYSCLDYYQSIGHPFSRELLARYNKRFPGAQQFTGGSACSGLYRGIKLWEAAVKECKSFSAYDVAAALDHAKIAEGPGGAAEMVPGQHHVRMNMYIGRAKAGAYEIVRSLGAIDPKERVHR